ncbi:MAG: radical SAM protein, partial [Candidatus Omnitrophica bacterium]|nr:radical SAM protein [Candidatus Omnitrophota bacterium]MBD3269060.1 radical SAM protein [Candidatus Omnitrophota bacterium]
MKVLLVDPPYEIEEIGGKNRSFKYALNRIPSLGLAYLASVGEEKGHEIKIYDCTLSGGAGDFDYYLDKFKPELIGFTATTPLFSKAVALARYARRQLPSVSIICGGPHSTACPEDTLNSEAFDFAVIGEGESTFSDLLDWFSDGKKNSPENIKGVAFKKEDKIIKAPSRPMITDLDSIPKPARHLLAPLNRYSPTPASYRRLPLGVIITSRGCPANCTFCDRAVFGEEYRKRSVSNIMEEIEELISVYGAKEIRFFDDTFTLDHSRIRTLCREIKKFKPPVSWTCLTRVDIVNPEVLKMMRDAGCWQVLYGLESGDNDILTKLGKNTTVEQNRQAVLWAKKAGLRIRADFLVGSPWETKDSFSKTVEFAGSLPLDFAHFNKFVPYPGTAIYEQLLREGYKFSFNEGAYINNPESFVYVPEGFSGEEFREKIIEAHKSFYLRPAYIMK